MTTPLYAIHPDILPGLSKVEPYSVEYLVNYMCEYMNFNTESVCSKVRKHGDVFARNMMAYILRDHFKSYVNIKDKEGKIVTVIKYEFNLKEIGKALGDRDHSTVIHSMESHENMMCDSRYTHYHNQYNRLKFFMQIKFPK